MEESFRKFDEKLTPDYIDSKTIDEMVMNQVIMNAMNQFIPSRMTSSRWKLPWIDNTIKRSIGKKKRLYLTKLKRVLHQLTGISFRSTPELLTAR